MTPARRSPAIRKLAQNIAVARRRCAQAHQVLAAQLAERPQQIRLVGEPARVQRDDGGAVAIGADPEQIPPFAAASDLDGAGRHDANEAPQ